jgi:hypothetical protein
MRRGLAGCRWPSVHFTACFVKREDGQPNLSTGDLMFTPLDILLGAAGVLVAVGISAPFLMLRSRAARHPRPAPVPARVARELQKQAS